MSLGVLAFVVALLVSIMLHEAGHLLTAKKFGMKATQYFVGFGPTLWSFRRGETEYGVKAIPAGGFVKIVGMTDLEEIEPGDEDRVFYKQPASQRAVVLAAGSATHFVLAGVLILFTLLVVGLPTVTTTIAAVSPCVTKPTDAECAGEPASPAKAAGLLPGDRVVEFEGEPVRSWGDDLAQRVRRHQGGPADIAIVREGQRITLTIEITRTSRKLEDGRVAEVGIIGVTPREEPERLSPGVAFRRTTSGMGALFAGTFKAIVDIPGELPRAARQAFSSEQRSPEDSLTGLVGAAQLSGQAVASGRVAEFLLLLAGLNVFIGVLNLLPLLPLDGGHLAILGFEQTRSWLARLTGRRDPGRVDIRKLLPAAYAVIVFFAGLTLLLLYSDISNPVTNPFQ